LIVDILFLFSLQTPREDVMEHREFLEMLGAVEALTYGQSEKLLRAIEGRGDLDEVHALIENRFENNKKCPHCGKKHLQRWGNAAGLQRFKCVSCRKTFNALTGTPLARLRKREQWLEFSATLLESTSVRKAAKRCKIAKDTSLLWRHRFLLSQKNNQDQKLKGIAEIDETFF
jgi:transposase-like protein